jgi:hypothetical protein
MLWVVLGVLAVLWAGILVTLGIARRRLDVRADVRRQERTLRALGHAAGWDEP